MQKLIQGIMKYAWLILGITVFASLFFGYQLRYTHFEDDITKYVPQNDPEVAFYNSLSDRFSSFQKKSMIVALEFDDLFTPQNLRYLQELVKKVKGLSVVQNVTALTNMPKIVTTDYGIEVKEVVDVLPQTEEEAKSLRQDLQEDELIWGKLVTPDGQGTIVMISFYEDVDEYKAIDEVEREINVMSIPAQITYFGFPIVMREVSKSARENMTLLTPISVVVLLAVLYLGFRSLQGVFLPIFISLLASMWTVGTAALFRQPLTVISASLPVMLLALVSAYGIHFINRYYEERGKVNPGSPELALPNTMKGVVVPIIMSALTTMAGFLSFLTAEIKPVSDLGIYSALGIFFGLLLTVFSLAALYRVYSPSRVPGHFNHAEKKSERDPVNWFMEIISRGVLYHKKVVIASLLGVTVIFVLGIPLITTETTVSSQMGENHPITRLLRYFEDRFGSTDYNYLWVSAPQVRNPFVLREMVRIGKYLERYQAFREASSIASFFLDLNKALDGQKTIPASQEKLDNLWFFAQDNEYIKGRIGDEDKETIIEFRAEETNSAQFRKELQEAKAFLLQRPQRVVPISVDEPEGREFLVKTIMEDLAIFGLSFSSPEELREKVTEIVSRPWRYFVVPQEDFFSAVIKDATLEIEDLGLSLEEVARVLEEAFPKDIPLEEAFLESFGLSEEEAQYLGEVIANSIERVAKNRKVLTLRETVENLVGRKLEEEFDFVFLQALDEEVYVPSPDDSGFSIQYRFTGTPVINDYVNGKLFSNQVQSMVLAFLIVFGLLVLQFRSLRKALMGMTPLLLTIASSFGLMGLFRIPLNVATLTIASIAIGAGVDYNIHFLSRWYRELALVGAHDAVRMTIKNTGRGILLNALGVAFGFYVLLFSPIGMLRTFGPLVATVLLLSAVYTLLLLPLLLHLGEFVKENKLKRGNREA
ncbi:MAG: efflux RND transporter permease subunit [Candidatus Caldatribacteriaceae bacterium]